MPVSDQMARMQESVNKLILCLDAGNTQSARLHLAKIRLLLATTPVDLRDEFAQLKMHDGASMNELLNSLEEQINQIEQGGTISIERIPINLGPGNDDDSCIW